MKFMWNFVRYVFDINFIIKKLMNLNVFNEVLI